MTRGITLFVIALSVSLYGCTPLTPEMQLIYDAGEVMGGANRIAETGTLLLEGEGRQFRLGQNLNPNDALPYWVVDEYRRDVDLANARWRVIQTRSSAFLTGNPVLRQEQTFGVDGDVAYEISEDRTVRRAGERVRGRPDG